MSVTTLEGTVVNGKIRLNEGIVLPEQAKVYILVPDFQIQPVARVLSPRVTEARQQEAFQKTLIETGTHDAEI